MPYVGQLGNETYFRFLPYNLFISSIWLRDIFYKHFFRFASFNFIPKLY